MQHQVKVYSAGDCPACPGFGKLLVLFSVRSGRNVFYCPTCGTAWDSLSPPSRLDQVRTIHEVAPDGVRLPSRAEVDRLSFPVEADEYEHWSTDLDDVLRKPDD